MFCVGHTGTGGVVDQAGMLWTLQYMGIPLVVTLLVWIDVWSERIPVPYIVRHGCGVHCWPIDVHAREWAFQAVVLPACCNSHVGVFPPILCDAV